MSKNKKKNYLYYFHFISIITFSLILLFFVALINYKIDPEKIYFNFFSKNKSNDTYSTVFVKKLINSEYGVSFQDNILSERDIKFKLANYPTNAECAVIGSSPILQISSYRKTRSFSSICDSILNLGTSGSVLEDYLIISEQLFLNKQPPKKIIISIYPYTLNFNRDKNWQKYSDEYYTFKNKLMNNKESNIISNKNSYNFLLLENLINLKYLIRSIQVFNSVKNDLIEVQQFDYEKGSKFSVMLPDGSVVYSSKFIKDAYNFKVDGITGMGDYKIKKNKWYNKDAIDLLNKLIIYLKQKFEVILVMKPYHPLVWEFPDRPSVKAMEIIEPIIIDIAKKNNVLLYGSFKPENIPCFSSEYFDEVHLMSTCAGKLENFLNATKRN
jgi:hypothetical protein